MHIGSKKRYLKAVENMIRVSNEFVLLVENWKFHDFVKDITRLLREIGQDRILYRLDSPRGARALLLSREQLPLGKRVSSDAEMRAPIDEKSP